MPLDNLNWKTYLIFHWRLFLSPLPLKIYKQYYDRHDFKCYHKIKKKNIKITFVKEMLNSYKIKSDKSIFFRLFNGLLKILYVIFRYKKQKLNAITLK